MAQRFRDDYVTLGLDDNADWACAQIQYRRQVNRWHPDRFAQRPRERLHAEQRFIQLTKAFERVRAFYRINSRLPFESLSKDLSVREADTRPRATGTRKVVSSAADIERPDFRQQLHDEDGIARFKGSEASPAPKSGAARRLLLWLVPGVMVVATGVVFVILDRNAQRANLEQARKYLLKQAPGDYTPSSSETHNRNRREAFVEGEGSGKMGDMLMPDVFNQ